MRTCIYGGIALTHMLKKERNVGEEELQQLIHYVVRGGWPGNMEVDTETAKNLPMEYLKAVIEDDDAVVELADGRWSGGCANYGVARLAVM